jgi:hypothetical protein
MNNTMATQAKLQESTQQIATSKSDHHSLIISPDDVLISSTVTSQFVLTHPGNLAFSVLLQHHCSELPPHFPDTANNLPVRNLAFIAHDIVTEIQRRGGQFIRLKDSDASPKTVLSLHESEERVTSILKLIRSVYTKDVASLLSVPEILFGTEPASAPSSSDMERAAFPLSYWLTEEPSHDPRHPVLVKVIPPQIPSKEIIQPTIVNQTTQPAEVILLTDEQIQEGIPRDASAIVHIYDRRVNLDLFAKDASLFSLMRAWVQDDPNRRISRPGTEMSDYDYLGATIVEPVETKHKNTSPSLSEKSQEPNDVFEQLVWFREHTPSKDTLRQRLIKSGQSSRRVKASDIRRRDRNALANMAKRGIYLKPVLQK